MLLLPAATGRQQQQQPGPTAGLEAQPMAGQPAEVAAQLVQAGRSLHQGPRLRSPKHRWQPQRRPQEPR